MLVVTSLKMTGRQSRQLPATTRVFTKRDTGLAVQFLAELTEQSLEERTSVIP